MFQKWIIQYEMFSYCLMHDHDSSSMTLRKMILNILNIRPEFDNERHFDACIFGSEVSKVYHLSIHIY